MYTGFWWGNLKEREHLEDTGIEGRIILRWIIRKWVVGGLDRIDLAQDRDRFSLRSRCKYSPVSSTGPGNQATTFLYVGRVSGPTILGLGPSKTVGVGTLLASQSLVPSSWHTTTAAPFVQYVSMNLGVNPSSGSSSTSPQIARWVLTKFSLET